MPLNTTQTIQNLARVAFDIVDQSVQCYISLRILHVIQHVGTQVNDQRADVKVQSARQERQDGVRSPAFIQPRSWLVYQSLECISKL